jgi:hypothetical protein
MLETVISEKHVWWWRQDSIHDLGGNVSTQQDAITSLAVKIQLIFDSDDVWLLQQPALIDKRKRAPFTGRQKSGNH